MRLVALASLIAFATLLTLACAGDVPPDAPAGLTPEETPPMANPPMGGPDPAAVRPGLSLVEILDESLPGTVLLDRLSAPRRAEIEAVANRHVPGQMDTLRTFVYDGLTLEFYDVTGGGVLLQAVTVTGEGYETAEGLGVGSTRDAVEAVYPASTGAEGRTITYERYGRPEDPVPTTLEVRYDGDRVEAMTWRFYVD